MAKCLLVSRGCSFPISRLAKAFASFTPGYELNAQYDAEEVIACVFNAYRDSCCVQGMEYQHRVENELITHTMKVLQIDSCMACMAEGFPHLKETPLSDVDYHYISMNRNVSNLLANQSSYRESACTACNMRAGYYGFEDFPRYPNRVLSMTTHSSHVAEAKESLQFRIGRRSSFKVTGNVLVLGTHRYALSSWIEYVDHGGFEAGHYITYKCVGGKVFKLSDACVTEVLRGIDSSTNVIFAVFIKCDDSIKTSNSLASNTQTLPLPTNDTHDRALFNSNGRIDATTKDIRLFGQSSISGTSHKSCSLGRSSSYYTSSSPVSPFNFRTPVGLNNKSQPEMKGVLSPVIKPADIATKNADLVTPPYFSGCLQNSEEYLTGPKLNQIFPGELIKTKTSISDGKEGYPVHKTLFKDASVYSTASFGKSVPVEEDKTIVD